MVRAYRRELAEFTGDLDDLSTIIDRMRELGECAELAEQCESIAQEWDDGDLDATDVETDVPFLDLMRIKIQETAQ